MQWWQCFVVAGAFGALIGLIPILSGLLFRTLQIDSLYLAQEGKYRGVILIAARYITALAIQFVLVGLILGTGVWFGYRLLF